MPLSGSILKSERFVVAVHADSLDRNIFQVQFSAGDGSTFVTFPYFQHTAGIVSVVSLAVGEREPTLELQRSGRVSSHLVKYSHHPDGIALFSQTGRVVSAIRKQSVPLSAVNGHLFTVHVHGLERFGMPRPKDARDRRPNAKRTRLSFRFTDVKPESIKFVGTLVSLETLADMVPSGIVEPRMPLVSPDGTIRHAFLISSPPGTPGERRVLLLSCEPLPRLDRTRPASLLFLGGFDPPDVVNDLSKATSVLAFSYPIENADELRRRIGSIDFIPRDIGAGGAHGATR